MPIHTYVCDSCGAEIERRQSFSEPFLITCQSCGGSLRRPIHPVGAIFKGSGFYNTDNRKSTGNGSSTDAESSEGKAKDGAADSKPKESGKAETDATKPAAEDSSQTKSQATASSTKE